MIVADNCIFHLRSPKRHFLEKTEGFAQGSITLALFMHKCDVMVQNQSHVAKHKMAEICIFSENVKICPFFVFIKNKIFVSVSVT